MLFSCSQVFGWYDPAMLIIAASFYHLPTVNLSQAKYADFTDLTEQIYYPEDFHNAKINNQSISWTSGNLSAVPGKDLSLDLWENFVSNMGYPDVADYDENSISFFKPQEGIDCYPAPGPFLPCNDLFDWWSLRCGVWIVFLLALLGNGCVVFVLVLSRSKMDVPRFLVANLAAADFCMGLYLGFLAVLDASTLGEFRKYAIQWQLSSACQVAGFFGVLSSELSVFTLAVITLERNYAITHAMHLNKRLSLKHAAYIMVGAWSFSILLASLPLIGVSDYRKFAICLPFETEGALSLGYVIFLLLINGVAFSILMGCYLKMYCAIRGSQCNPFLYAILTKQFKKDCVMICKAIEESRVTRGIGRCRHSSNFSNRQTPANTDSLNSGSGSGNHSKNSQHCSCTTKKVNKLTPRWPLNKLKSLLCGIKESPELNSQNEWNYQIAEIQEKQNKTKRNTSVSSENFSSSRSGSWKQGHCVPLRFLERPRRRNSWTVTRKPSQDSNLSSSRNDSAGSNSTQSTNTWRMSRSSVSSDIGNSLGRAGSGYSDRSGHVNGLYGGQDFGNILSQSRGQDLGQARDKNLGQYLAYGQGI
ncbi:lutropin-choriogonadotropic hormone receptor [Eurytemora carolleeae]|uniref:lutropin-choriogonadotropic hormone receptor n=1 Tax=Eurytemora carolleeae TaxID=1294199 RepID=UPI000C775BDF|nr:lutropin-choriogonadotropic hormone receptor [Eurytemora carolleeae]|eukprot:XP_023336535.1 lutropin-choriogonadotropic hormone receptor-like [Eurytemora affinis]